mgnify:CR=1 FL=1
MEQEKNKNVVLTPQQQEIEILQIKRQTEFDLTPIGQQVKQFEAIQRMAMMYAMSNFVPQSYKYDKNGQPFDPKVVLANCTIALEMATRMQANPLMVMQNLYIVYGQPAFNSKFLIACINASKRFSPLRYEFKGEEGTDEYACRAIAYEANDIKHKEPLEGDWISMRMAKAEGWVSRKGSKWSTMPTQMLRYRAAAFWQRAYCPEISMGLITAEEAQDTFAQTYEEIKQPSATTEIPTDELGRPSLTSVAAQAAQDVIVEADNAQEQKEEEQQELAQVGQEQQGQAQVVNTAAEEKPKQEQQKRPSLL